MNRRSFLRLGPAVACVPLTALLPIERGPASIDEGISPAQVNDAMREMSWAFASMRPTLVSSSATGTFARRS